MPDPNPRRTAKRTAHQRRPPLVLVRERDRSSLLTSRQLQVLVLMCSGLTMKQVASQLDVSHTTLRRHLMNAIRRTKAHTRDQLMAMAGASGLYHEAVEEKAIQE